MPLSILAQKYIVHKDHKPASFANHGYLIEPFNDLHPRIAIEKSAQLGITTAHAWKALMFAKRYGSRIALQISFPAAKDAEVFSQTRFSDIVNVSPLLSRLIQVNDHVKKAQQVFQARVKMINGCAIYFYGRSRESQAISIDTNVVFIDERDFDKDDTKIALLEGRVGHDFVFKTENTSGIIEQYSTPSMPGYGIDSVFNDSDQRFFFITCTRCNHEYINTFGPDCVHGFYERGEDPYRGDIYWRCPKCKRRLDVSEVGHWDPREPLIVKNCRWIPTKPENSVGYQGMHGYRMGKDNVAFQWVSPTKLLHLRDGKIYKKNPGKFHNQELGLPHMGSNATVNIELLERNIRGKDVIIWKKKALNTIIGCDQGCWLVVGEKIYGSESESCPDGHYGIIHIEHIHEDLAFDTVQDDGGAVEGFLSKRIKEFGASIVVIDNMPNTASARRLAGKFNQGTGRRHGTKIWRLISSKNTQQKSYIFDEDECTVSENRNHSLDALYSTLNNQEIIFPGKGQLIQEIDSSYYRQASFDMIDLLFDHICKETKISNLPEHLDPEANAASMQKGADAKGRTNQTIRSFGNYVTIGDKQNHLLHALKMFRIGIDIVNSYGKPKIILPYVNPREFYMKE